MKIAENKDGVQILGSHNWRSLREWALCSARHSHQPIGVCAAGRPVHWSAHREGTAHFPGAFYSSQQFYL